MRGTQPSESEKYVHGVIVQGGDIRTQVIRCHMTVTTVSLVMGNDGVQTTLVRKGLPGQRIDGTNSPFVGGMSSPYEDYLWGGTIHGVVLINTIEPMAT